MLDRMIYKQLPNLSLCSLLFCSFFIYDFYCHVSSPTASLNIEVSRYDIESIGAYFYCALYYTVVCVPIFYILFCALDCSFFPDLSNWIGLLELSILIIFNLGF
ncbi:hypothetical protein O7U_00942 [Bartonella quintana JK 68]|uniref:Uncharacterized protein n=1 Tax=Bartonella quintana JK 68 TaxID=1134503 RepID=A0ABR4SQ91_BARQI|nr:hypothetical protein O7U_00942 [Bartonella quintana JK 68]KEC65528.1 hypothetical protein O7W_00305 [Bartonella quintana JK 56]